MSIESRAEDEDLIRRLLRGKEDAFTAIYEKYGGPVYRFALYMTGDTHMAEEITQDTFLFLLANAGSYEAGRGSLLSWMLGVARNNSRRAAAVDREAEGLNDLAECDIADQGDLDEDFAQRELVESVRRLVGSLPTNLREVVILCELQEMNYKEAAAALGCPIGTVRSRLSRARALLVSKLRTGCSA